MLVGPGIDLATIPIIEQMRRLSVNRFAPPAENHHKIGVGFGNYFNLLGLPNEIIALVFSFLPIADRMRSRLNRRLNEIESRNKYYVDSVLIAERLSLPADSTGNDIIFLDGRSYSSDCIRRIGQNASIGSLRLELYGSGPFHREVYNLVKDFDVKRMDLTVMYCALEKEFLIDSFLLVQARKCEALSIIGYDDITAEALHQAYKILIDDSSNLRYLRATSIRNVECISFLLLIGITYRDGKFYSKRNIQAREEFLDDDDDVCVHFFDCLIELTITFVNLTGDDDVVIEFTYHETPEALERAKSAPGLARFRVYPEFLLRSM